MNQKDHIAFRQILVHQMYRANSTVPRSFADLVVSFVQCFSPFCISFTMRYIEVFLKNLIYLFSSQKLNMLSMNLLMMKSGC